MRKHLRWGLILAVLLVVISTGSVYAAGGHFSGRHYVDSNSDGICDNWGTSHHGGHGACSGSFVDENGDGVCDNCDTSHCGGHGACSGSFVDENGDGICDNRGTSLCGGMGLGRHTW